MTIKDLYDLCANLCGSSWLTIRNSREELIDEGYYNKIGAEYGDRVVTDFRINDDRNATIYIGGVR